MGIYINSDNIVGGYSTSKQYADEYIWIQRGHSGLGYNDETLDLIDISLQIFPSSRDKLSLFLTGEDADKCWKMIQSQVLIEGGADMQFINWVYKTYFTSIKPDEIIDVISKIIASAEKTGRNEMRTQIADLLLNKER